MPDIPKGFGGISDLLERFKKASELYEQWRSLYQEAFEYAAPNRETFTQYSPGQRKNRRVFDSTAIQGVQQFASRVQGALLPPWQNWADLTAGEEIPEGDVDTVNAGLEKVSERFFTKLNHSNFYTELPQTLTDLAIGTGAILVEEGEFDKGEVMRFTNVPLAELYIEKPGAGAIENVWRKHKIRPNQIKRVWPQAELPDSLQKLADKEGSDEVEILNGVLYNPEDGLYHQMVIYAPAKALLFTQSFKTKRFIVARWHVTPGEAYGRGPVILCLPDILTANKVKQFILENAALQMAGVYTGVDDGIFNPHTVRIHPGTVIPVGSNANQNPSLRPLDRSGDLGLGGLILEDLQNNIRKCLFADPMGDLTDPVRSATEVMLRNQDMLRNQGAAFGRLKTELIEPLMAAVMDILQGRGLVPKLRVDGTEVTIRQNSPLAKAESMENFQNSQMWFQTVSALPPEIVMGSVKVEELPRYWQEALGVPSELIRSDDEREQIAKAASAAAEQQLQAQGGQVGQ